MIIYLDIIFFENIIMNYIILYATLIIIKSKKNIIRLSLSSIIGALYSVLSISFLNEIFSNIFLKIFLSVVMTYIAFNPKNIKILFKYFLIFYLVSFIFGGAALSLIYFIKPQEILVKNGLFLGTYPFKSVFLGAIIAFLIIKITIKILKHKFSKKEILYNIKIILDKKEVKTQAILDTGNMLKEPITNTSVIIAESSLLTDIIPREILFNTDQILLGDLSNIPEKILNKYLSKLKIIPFSSLGKENGMLVGIKADKIIIQNDENEKEITDVIIGIYNKILTKKGEYHALIGLDFIN